VGEFEELKNFAIADILSASGKEKTARVIENHMNNLIEVSLIKGQQSQQAKIDELQNKLDYHVETNADLAKLVLELQAGIDLVLETVSDMGLSQHDNDFDSGYDQAVSDLFINLKSILKGNKDEN